MIGTCRRYVSWIATERKGVGHGFSFSAKVGTQIKRLDAATDVIGTLINPLTPNDALKHHFTSL